MEVNDIKWKRVHHGFIDVPLIDYLENLVNEQYELGIKLKICVGTDSQKKGKGFSYASAIIIEMKVPLGGDVYKGVGAKVISGTYYEKFKSSKHRPSITERMLNEVQTSINVCYYLLDLIELYDIDLEIHADVNPNPMWASHVAFNQVKGYCEGMNIPYRVKPDAYAASHGADRWANKGVL